MSLKQKKTTKGRFQLLQKALGNLNETFAWSSKFLLPYFEKQFIAI